MPVTGSVCSPSGLHDVPGVGIRLLDVTDDVVTETITDPLGMWSGEIPVGRFTLEVGGGGNFQAFDVVTVDGAAPLASSVCLERGTPQALLFRSTVAEATDLLHLRLSGLGLDHVHDGPSDAGPAAQILASPSGLVEYGIVALLGGLDFAQIAEQPGALDGLRDHLEGGGGLVLGAEAAPILQALAPGSVSLVPEPAFGGWVEADVTDETLAAQLDWPSVGIPVPKDGRLVVAGAGAEPLLRAWVPVGPDATLTQVDLLTRVAVGEGEVLLSSFLAPPPRADAWWMGDPADFSLPDGVWDGRGGVLDRLLLQL